MPPAASGAKSQPDQIRAGKLARAMSNGIQPHLWILIVFFLKDRVVIRYLRSVLPGFLHNEDSRIAGLADGRELGALLHYLDVTITSLMALIGMTIPNVDWRTSKNPLEHRIRRIVGRERMCGNVRFC